MSVAMRVTWESEPWGASNRDSRRPHGSGAGIVICYAILYYGASPRRIQINEIFKIPADWSARRCNFFLSWTALLKNRFEEERRGSLLSNLSMAARLP